MQKFPFPVETLKQWFLEAKRDLPWRHAPTPYAVWVAEIMLQQTQVAVVKEYYQRWMVRFPTIEALAVAPLEEVIKTWEGLGYYSRARHLHQAAQFLRENHGGALPSSKEELAKVKGLGPYTVGAILSFAFRQKAAAVDGNAVRVLTRYFALDDDVQSSAAQKKIWEIAEAILPDKEPWLIVEGLIELGAMICKREPECASCPLQAGCEAHHQGKQRELPRKARKTKVTAMARDVFVVMHGAEVLVRKGKKGEVMEDLYEFPYADRSEGRPPFAFAADKLRDLPEERHCFTRYRVTLYPSLWKASERTQCADYEWIGWKELRNYPFSSGHRRILKNLGERNALFAH